MAWSENGLEEWYEGELQGRFQSELSTSSKETAFGLLRATLFGGLENGCLVDPGDCC